jgi:hypothetical protein
MMSDASDSGAAIEPGRSTTSRRNGWLGSLALGMTLWLIYSANDRCLGGYDAVGTSLLPLNILRGDGVYLDRFWPVLRERNGELAPIVARSRDHIVSRYPLAPALLVMPMFAAQVAIMDWRHPGWDRNLSLALTECNWMAKRAMAPLMALAGVVLYRYLIGLELYRAALPSVLAAGLGSSLWTVGSQALWQHGPAALALIVAIALLHPKPVPRWRLVLAGLATTFLFASRLIDVLFTVVIGLWVARSEPKKLAWFLPAPVLGAIALIGYNFWFFGTVTGGQAQLERLHARLHGVGGPWAGNLFTGAAGTLFSPNRGLFVFSPWIALALATVAAAAPALSRRLASHRLNCWLLWALIPYFILFAKYAVWWGGHCFGPRYWTDVIPLFAILLAFEIDWMLARSRGWVVFLTVTLVASIGVQAVGAFCYPSTWNLLPANVDLHHERLWDWRDTELSRCLTEAMNRHAH